jgi:outer membrane receptor protein involved in Fe transport
VEGEIKTPFYSGKLSWVINNNNTLTASTFADFTEEEGHLFAGSGFGNDPASFRGLRETGGHNYSVRLNSNFTQNWIAELAFGLHYARNNVFPEASVLGTSLNLDNFAILNADGTVAPVTLTNDIAGATNTRTATGFIDYVYAPGGTLQRNFIREGFGLYQEQARDRWEFSARFQNIWGRHTLKYGFEYYNNAYDNFQTSSGPSNVFNNSCPTLPGGECAPALNGSNPANVTVNGFRITNSFSVCTTRDGQIVCPSAVATDILSGLSAFPTGITGVVTGTITPDEALNNPFLVRTTTRVRDFTLNAETETRVQSFYFQDDFRARKNLQFNLGVRWDMQQAFDANGGKYLKLNNLWDTLQPRLGVSWDPSGNGKSKIFANYAVFVETPIPLDLNVRAGGGGSQTDKNFNVNRWGAPIGSTVATGFATRNLGADPTPVDVGLKPQTVYEVTAGFEHEWRNNITVGVRGIYRAQGTVIEDGSFDDGNHYFIFNPGEPLGPGNGGPTGNTEFKACQGGQDDGHGGLTVPRCFGRGRRYYRAVEFTFNRRFANNFMFNTSYVFSSLIGNYEGLFRNDNGQADPNITSLFDLQSLLDNTYGRLPNDRPHQFKFNGSYTTPFKLVMSGNFYIQSGIPFSALIPHPVYGNNEGFLDPRGTSIIPTLPAEFSGGVESAQGGNRTPTTYNLDLGFYYPINFNEDMQLRFTADWFNVFNTQRAVTLDQTFLINSGVAGIPPVANPFFGTGLIYQYPSALRLGAKFSF